MKKETMVKRANPTKPIIFALGMKNVNNTKILETFLEHGLDLNVPYGDSTL